MKKGYIFLILLCCTSITVAQGIRTDYTTFSDQELIEDILLGSSCVDNVRVTNTVSGNFNGNALSYGYFDARGTSFPLQEGIILSTGRISSAEGPNNSRSDDNAPGWSGDADINNEFNIEDSINATIIEFDFRPQGDGISFRYIFASEEYQEFNDETCNDRFSDAFAFFIRPQGTTTYENIALVPGTNIPIQVHNVHPEIRDPNGGGCPPFNEEFFDKFNPESNTSTAPINFNGQTTVLTAETTVTPNTLYEIKLVIADKENGRFDSGVFLEAGSFSSTTEIGDDLLIRNGNALCPNETTTLTALEEPVGENYNYMWFRNGIPQPTPTPENEFTVTQDGTYSVEVMLDANCTLSGEATIEYFSQPNPSNTSLEACDANNDGIEVFNLTNAEQAILQGMPNLAVDGYFQSQMGAETNDATDEISMPETYTVTTAMDLVYARVINQGGCVDTAEITLIINAGQMLMPKRLDECGTNGFASFNLADASTAFNTQIANGTTYKYFRNEADAESDSNEIIDLNYINEVANFQTLTVVAEHPTVCYEYTTVELVVTNGPNLPPSETVAFCFSSETPTLTLSANAQNTNASTQYRWSTGEQTPEIEVMRSGQFLVEVTNTNGVVNCTEQRTITVENNFISDLDVAVDGEFPNFRVTLTASGSGNLQYSLDAANGPFQDSNVFENVTPGEHIAYARNGDCGIIMKAFAVLDFPDFFTPNNDGFNDTWNVANNDTSSNLVKYIYIFDRYGKLLKTLLPSATGWDGTFNGKPLPSSDYWFVAQFDSGFEYKNHFTLKR